VSQSLDLLISAKNSTDAAFKQMQVGLDGVEAELKQVSTATEIYAGMTQKQRQGVEAAHEAALKMNTGMVATSDKSELLARNFDALQGAVTTTAGAFGVSAAQLGPLNQAVDVASLGMDKLKGTTAGFNVATLAAAGAAASLGVAIGTWLRTFPAVAKFADDAAASLVRLFTAQKDLDAQVNAMAGLGEFQKKMAASHEEAIKRQVASMKEAGNTALQIEETLSGKRKSASERAIEQLKKEVTENKKAAKESEKAWEDYVKALGTAMAAFFDEIAKNRAAVEGLMGLLGPSAQDATIQMGRLADATERWGGVSALSDAQLVTLINSMREQIKVGGENEEGFRVLGEAMDEAANRGDAVAKAAGFATDKQDKMTASAIRLAEALRAAETSEMWRESAREAGFFADILNEVDGLLGELGISAQSSLGELVKGLAGAAEGAANLAEGFASMNPAQIISGLAGIAGAVRDLVSSESGLNRFVGGALVGGPIGGLAALIFGGGPNAAERLAHDIRMMQTEFINTMGGLSQLETRAAAAGVSLDAMWNARTVAEYEAAISQVQRAIELTEEATQKTKDAMDRWGITIDQLGPAFAGQLLGEQLLDIYQDFRLLEAAGVDVATMLEGPMGDALSTLVQQAIATGAELPLTMKPWIEELMRSGQLIDENGQAITDVSQLHFTETLEEGVGRLITKIEELVAALLGIPPEVETLVKVNTEQSGNGPPFPGGADNNPATPWPMAEGGWFPARPGGYPVTVGEAGDEAIIPKDKMAAIVAQAMAMAGGGGGVVHNHFHLDGREIRGWYLRQEGAGMLTGAQ
jgi:hypothetical protein